MAHDHHHHHHHHGGERPPLPRLILRIALSVVIVGLLVAYSMYFEVSEDSGAVVTRFGKPVRQLTDAGPYWKLPAPIDQVDYVDVRKHLFNTPFTATLTKDQKNVILLTYVVWKVDQPLLFLQSAGTREEAEQKLDGMITDAKNYFLGTYNLSELLSVNPNDVKTEQIEQGIHKRIADSAMDKFGIDVQQVGIKRIALPEENLEEVLKQMRAERRAEADRLRAEGEKQAQDIRNAALVESQKILEEGREKAGEIRGRAEKDAAAIYAQAQQLDPKFYRFWRSLQALKEVLGSQSMVILRNDQGIFKYLAELPEFEAVAPPLLEPAADAPATQEPTP